MVLTGGCLVSFKIKSRQVFHQRKNRYPLFGAYVCSIMAYNLGKLTSAQVYSGMFARDELHEALREDALDSRTRVYQDGLQVSTA